MTSGKWARLNTVQQTGMSPSSVLARRLRLNGTLSASSTQLLKPHLLTAVMRLFPLSSAEVRSAASWLRRLQPLCNISLA
jgi:hypothetical protein